MYERNMDYKSKSSIPEEAKVKKGLCNCEVVSLLLGREDKGLIPSSAINPKC